MNFLHVWQILPETDAINQSLHAHVRVDTRVLCTDLIGGHSALYCKISLMRWWDLCYGAGAVLFIHSPHYDPCTRSVNAFLKLMSLFQMRSWLGTFNPERERRKVSVCVWVHVQIRQSCYALVYTSVMYHYFFLQISLAEEIRPLKWYPSVYLLVSIFPLINR